MRRWLTSGRRKQNAPSGFFTSDRVCGATTCCAYARVLRKSESALSGICIPRGLRRPAHYPAIGSFYLVLPHVGQMDVGTLTLPGLLALPRWANSAHLRLAVAGRLTSSTLGERRINVEPSGPAKIWGRAISVESGMRCDGALEPKLQHAHFCVSMAHQRPATLEPTSRQKPERRRAAIYVYSDCITWQSISQRHVY